MTTKKKPKLKPVKKYAASKKMAPKCAKAHEVLKDGHPIVITDVQGEDLKVESVEDLLALTMNLRDRINMLANYILELKQEGFVEKGEKSKPRTIKAEITFERVHECGIAAMNRKRAERNGGPIEYGG